MLLPTSTTTIRSSCFDSWSCQDVGPWPSSLQSVLNASSPAWSFEKNNLIALRLLYETSCTGYRFYIGTTITSVNSSINAYIGQCCHISSISVYRAWMTHLGSGFDPPRMATSPAHVHVQNSSDTVTLALEYQVLRSGTNSLSTYGNHLWVYISSPRNLKLCCSSERTISDQCTFVMDLTH